jgi:hypothetical protein
VVCVCGRGGGCCLVLFGDGEVGFLVLCLVVVVVSVCGVRGRGGVRFVCVCVCVCGLHDDQMVEHGATHRSIH